MPRRADLAATVARLFAAAGDLAQAATLIRSEPGVYDPATGAAGMPTTNASSCTVLFDQAARPRFSLLDGLEAGPGEQMAWLHGATFAPRAGDRLAVGGSSRVVNAVGNLHDLLFVLVCK